MKTHLNNKNILAKGFSLVEMLVVIAVIGVIAAIAIPSIGSITGAAGTAKTQRNAQTLASVYSAAQAAGASASADKASGCAAVIGGITGAGAFSGETFKVPGMSAAEAGAATAYLNDSMEYIAAGGQTPSVVTLP